MKIAFFVNDLIDSQKSFKYLQLMLKDCFTFDQINPDIVISIGGDGTFLSAIHQYHQSSSKIQFVAFCTGNLGFYADFNNQQMDLFVQKLIKNEYKIQKYNLLNVMVNNCQYWALNDFRIESIFTTAIIEVFINDQFLELYRGNGLSVATTSGSTAYNKSLGGAVMWPSVKGFQLAEVAPLSSNLYSSLGASLVLSSNDKITFKTKIEKGFIGIDNICYDINGQQTINVTIASQEINILRFKHKNFIKRLQHSFIK